MSKKIKQIPKVEIYDLMPDVEPESKENKSNWSFRYWTLLVFTLLVFIYGYGVVSRYQGRFWFLNLIPFIIIVFLFIMWIKGD